MNELIKKGIGADLEVKNVPEDLKADRRAVFATCVYHVNNEKCGQCGCYTEIKSGMDYNRNPARRFRIEKTHCPEGFSPYIDTDGIRHENDKIFWSVGIFKMNLLLSGQSQVRPALSRYIQFIND